MVIFIRGLPGSGKTTISNKLGEKTGYKVIHTDDFKAEIMTSNPKAFFHEEVVPYSRKRILEVLENSKNENLIVEDLFRDENFVRVVQDVCVKNNIVSRWFNITRDMPEIVEVNENRTRKVKNSPEILESMRKQIENIKIDGEVIVINDDVEKSVLQIFEKITSA